jgi:hypothetical protein
MAGNGEGFRERARHLRLTRNVKRPVRRVFPLAAAGIVLAGSLGLVVSGAAPAGALAPANYSGSVNGVSCTSATDCTAVGDMRRADTVSETAGVWGAPDGFGADNGVSCTSATDCTSVGGDVAVIETAGVWGPQTVFSGVYLSSVSCTSATDCTAVGNDNSSEPLYVTETAGVWGLPTEVPGLGVFTGVSCTSATDCTAVGDAFALTETAGVWGTPNEVLSPVERLTSVSCTDALDCTAGGQDDSNMPVVVTLTAGSWDNMFNVAGIQLTMKLSKSVNLRGHIVVKASGTTTNVGGGDADTEVSLHECTTPYFSPDTCEDNGSWATFSVKPTGKFSLAPFTVDVGVVVGPHATCGLVDSHQCYLVEMFHAGESMGVPLSFLTPTAKLATPLAVRGNFVDKVIAKNFPIGDTVTAEECDATVSVPATVSSDCDPATLITGTVAATGVVSFGSGIRLKVGGAYSDAAAGTCAPGATCKVVVQDQSNPFITADIAATADVSFAIPTAKLATSTAVRANLVDKVTAKNFPIGDTVTAEECDATVSVPATVSSNCDSATLITGTVAATGVVSFSPTGVAIKVGAAYVETGSGSVTAGGNADVVVIDTTTAGIAEVIPITIAP